jgi:hypothetical protein
MMGGRESKQTAGTGQVANAGMPLCELAQPPILQAAYLKLECIGPVVSKSITCVCCVCV